MHLSPLRAWWLRRRFPMEDAILEARDIAANHHRSVIHFSVNKAATQFVESILRRCAVENGLIPIDLHRVAFLSDLPFLDTLSADEMSQYRHLFRPRGFLYSVFGGMIEGLDLDDYLIVLVVRDPRDVLTSEFFSTAFSHTPPPFGRKNRDFMDRRRSAINKGIDKYVLEESERVGSIYARYASSLHGRPNLHVTKYERMVTDFPSWLDEVLDFCKLKASENLMRQLLLEGSPECGIDENVKRHRRQVLPGDFRRKLSSKTIADLNQKLKDVLAVFQYSA